MCERCAELEAQVAELEQALEGAVWVQRDEHKALMRTLRLSAGEASMMLLLRQVTEPMSATDIANGAITSEARSAHTREDPEFRSANTVRQWGFRLRRRLPEAVRSVKGRGGGYLLTDKGRAMLTAALACQ